MINIFTGDTIVFEANLKDIGGTAVTNASGNLSVYDSAGSYVYSNSVPHISDGTYQRSVTTSGWAIGPIREFWAFTSVAGTISQSIENKFNIIGSTSQSAYVGVHELFAYYENIENYFDGSERERVYDSYLFINQQLNTLGYRTPVSKGTSGYYDQSLRDWNAWDSIYRLVVSRAVSQTRDNEEKPWFDYFKKRADEKWEQYRSKKLVLDDQTSPGEAGIQPAVKIGGTLYSSLLNNWEGYGGGFKGEDFPRTWRVECIGTGTAGGLNESTLRWSNDNGLTWMGTINAYPSWQYLLDEVYVRFERGTYTGTTGIFSTSDVWQFKTAPLKLSSGGNNSAASY